MEREKILVMGGTQFIGRNLVERLLKSDRYEITLFNRQISNADVYPQCRKIKGDRSTSDIDQVGKTDWDHVIDLSGYYPAQLESLLANLQSPTKNFIFVSTCSVYDNGVDQTILRNEDAAIHSCTIEQAADRGDSTYGHRKAECERVLGKSGLNHVILRPSLVYGRYDYTDRFYYWLYQTKFKSTLLLPDNGERRFAITYVEDLVSAIEESLTSKKPRAVYTITSIPQVSVKDIVKQACSIFGTEPQIKSASPEFLHTNGVKPWVDMPLWLDCEYFTYDNERIQSDFDFRFVEFEASVKESIKYFDEIGWNEPIYGITEKERSSLLEKL
jgi:2'-hydroxyisoflavone reductase